MSQLLLPGVSGSELFPPMDRVRYRVINATDGVERIWRDHRGRVTRHVCMRASKPYVNACYKYVSRDGKITRVEIDLEEWKRRNPKAF